MVSADRQLIMETNRSLRNIKTELENLLEKGVIDEAVFDQIHAALPQESPLSGPLRTTNGNTSTTAARDSPAPATSSTTSPPPPTQQMQNLGINNGNPTTTSPSPGPPSYDQTPAPSLPSRSIKPVLAHARALYRYVASDNRDVSFDKDDKIVVHQYMNQDWWMGQNTRTGQEGIFPRNYVLVEHEEQKSAPYAAAPYAQPQYGYPPPGQGPPQQQNPYNSNVPPMAVAEGGQPANGEQQQGGDSKVGEYGKKFGKKLGNAAIFGAGATIGGNIVNSIF
ncbi:SH3 and variant SH3 domain protein [Metarhizium robertsii]|uniref:Src like protein n=2 Tax=Metarhizium robertsii TaxID=568076 RepID=E9EUR6_METRA|nr:Src like protein [Metarhizium robertsii ARSEF 23]EFZ01169.1 Src like protein [Metarhizium robertsii ARSEF 23]EXV03729.1 SH3 and variant SH3 domain protein [Metarhizium robertsii]